jgi:hypothetical protein
VPYIVTTKSRYSGANDLGYWATTSRRAVATLEEAHETAREACLYAPGSVKAIAQAVRDVFALSESGGTVTLPDGTVIEVDRVSMDDLIRRMGDDLSSVARVIWPDDEILAKFNAKQASA